LITEEKGIGDSFKKLGERTKQEISGEVIHEMFVTMVDSLHCNHVWQSPLSEVGVDFFLKSGSPTNIFFFGRQREESGPVFAGALLRLWAPVGTKYQFLPAVVQFIINTRSRYDG
jgi:hypothetical protein